MYLIVSLSMQDFTTASLYRPLASVVVLARAWPKDAGRPEQPENLLVTPTRNHYCMFIKIPTNRNTVYQILQKEPKSYDINNTSTTPSLWLFYTREIIS